MEILSYLFRNRDVHTAYHTDRIHLDEIIVYLLGEKVLSGFMGEFEIDNRMLGYIRACLHELDQPHALIIYEEIKKRVEEISSDLVFQSLLVNGEFYLKYDYILGRKFTKLNLYIDPSECAWRQW